MESAYLRLIRRCTCFLILCAALFTSALGTSLVMNNLSAAEEVASRAVLLPGGVAFSAVGRSSADGEQPTICSDEGNSPRDHSTKKPERTHPKFAPTKTGEVHGHVIGESGPVHRTEDVIYGRKYGMALTMDVFQPSKPNGCGIIYLVNGGWFSSKKTPRMQNVQPDYYRIFLDHGYTVFAVVTSSQPKYTIPELMSDVQRAVRFVRGNAKRFGVFPDRLGVTGASSGGHLTLTIATQGGPGVPNAPDPIDRESSVVQAAACFFPPTDFLNYGGLGINGVAQGPMKPLQAAFGPRSLTEKGRQALGKEISPIYYVTPQLPPTLIIHGDADDIVPLQQSESFLKRAKSVGAEHVELIIRPGKSHGWPKGGIVWKSREDIQEFVNWFDKFLLKQ